MKPDLAIKEMTGELLNLLRFLKRKKLILDDNVAYGIGDSLKAATTIVARDDLRWGYKSGKINLILSHASINHPSQPSTLMGILEMEVQGKTSVNMDGDLLWDLSHISMNFEFHAESTTAGKGWSQYWHLDTHVDKPGATPPDECHPKFHLHFGGGRMADRRKLELGCWGKTLELSGPRIAHAPMDLVLAIDFILSNSTGPRWKGELLKSKEYRDAVGNAQRRFWKPYSQLISDFYNTSDRRILETHQARLLMPTLC